MSIDEIHPNENRETVVIGGGSLSGGEGSVSGSIIGALIMTVIRVNGSTSTCTPKVTKSEMLGSCHFICSMQSA